VLVRFIVPEKDAILGLVIDSELEKATPDSNSSSVCQKWTRWLPKATSSSVMPSGILRSVMAILPKCDSTCGPTAMTSQPNEVHEPEPGDTGRVRLPRNLTEPGRLARSSATWRGIAARPTMKLHQPAGASLVQLRPPASPPLFAFAG